MNDNQTPTLEHRLHTILQSNGAFCKTVTLPESNALKDLAALVEDLLQQQQAGYDDSKWFHPLTVSPENGEIVVIACDVDAGRGDDSVAQILQTCVYELRDDKTEAWHCGQPFKLLRRWLRLPAVPQDTIVQVKSRLIV